MRYVGSFSADTYDLQKAEERERLRLFAANFFDEIGNNTLPPKSYMPVTWRDFDYAPSDVEHKIDVGNKKVLIVTDSQDHQTNLVRMIERFRASFSSEIEVINLWDIDIKGACLGCNHCGYDNQCVYEGKDDYIDFYNTKVKTADILVWAGTIKDRYLSSRWKVFFDRSCFTGHAPSLIGKQIGVIISGPLSQVSNLRQILEGHVEVKHGNLGGFVTDEYGDSTKIDNSLQYLARRLVQFADNNYIKPSTFLGVGGTRIFRDAVWGRFRFSFRADHMAYRKLGIYDFPQKEYKARIKNAIFLLLLKSPAFRVEFNKRRKKEMIKPLQKVLENLEN
jgi:multimeric flavodoxin WrbA